MLFCFVFHLSQTLPGNGSVLVKYMQLRESISSNQMVSWPWSSMVDVAFDGLKHVASSCVVFIPFAERRVRNRRLCFGAYLQEDDQGKYFCRVELIFLCRLIPTPTAAPQRPPLPHFSMPKFKFVVVCLFRLPEVCHMMFCQCICNVPVLFCRNIVTLRRRNQTFWIVWRRQKMTMTLTINVDALWYSARSHRPEVSCCWRAACSSRLFVQSPAPKALGELQWGTLVGQNIALDASAAARNCAQFLPFGYTELFFSFNPFEI